MKTYEAWNGFVPGEWSEGVNVRDFIQKNYTPYTGNGDFLAPATEKTLKLFDKVKALMEAERQAGGVLDIDEHTISTIPILTQ